jgi:hypothetical protein
MRAPPAHQNTHQCTHRPLRPLSAPCPSHLGPGLMLAVPIPAGMRMPAKKVAEATRRARSTGRSVSIDVGPEALASLGVFTSTHARTHGQTHRRARARARARAHTQTSSIHRLSFARARARSLSLSLSARAMHVREPPCACMQALAHALLHACVRAYVLACI